VENPIKEKPFLETLVLVRVIGRQNVRLYGEKKRNYNTFDGLFLMEIGLLQRKKVCFHV
jgi:hypothetical protein